MNNYFSLNRKIFDNDLWLKDRFTWGQAWVDLFGNANYKDGSFFVRGNKVEVKRGQLAWSIRFMMKRWKWSQDRVNNFLNYLKTNTMIDTQKSSIINLITVINYNKYQNTNTDTDTPTNTQTNTQTNTILNKDNKDNNILDKSNIIPKGFGNEKVNLVIETFKKYTGKLPIDKSLRREAYSLSQRIDTFNKKRNLEANKENFIKVLEKLFNKLSENDYFERIEKLEAVRLRAISMFDQALSIKKPNV